MEKIFLDANEFYGYFKDVIKAMRKNETPKIPKGIQKLASDQETNYVTSIFVKTEVKRRFRQDNSTIASNEFEALFAQVWEDLRVLLRIDIVQTFVIDEKFYNFIDAHVCTCKTADLIHLYLAKELNAKIYSNDKNVRDAAKILGVKL